MPEGYYKQGKPKKPKTITVKAHTRKAPTPKPKPTSGKLVPSAGTFDIIPATPVQKAARKQYATPRSLTPREHAQMRAAARALVREEANLGPGNIAAASALYKARADLRRGILPTNIPETWKGTAARVQARPAGDWVRPMTAAERKLIMQQRKALRKEGIGLMQAEAKLMPGDIKGASDIYPRLSEIKAAGIFPELNVTPATKIIQDFAGMSMGSFYGMGLLLADPFRKFQATRAILKQYRDEIMDPGKAFSEHPLLTTYDFGFVLPSAVGGALARIPGAAEALRSGDVGALSRAIYHNPTHASHHRDFMAPDLRRIHYGDKTLYVEQSRNALVRAFNKHIRKEGVSEAEFNAASKTRERTIKHEELGPELVWDPNVANLLQIGHERKPAPVGKKKEKSKFLRGVDTYNQASVGAMLYLGTKYPIMNTAGQLWLAATQGALNPRHLAEAFRIRNRLVKERPLLYGRGKEPLAGGLAKSLRAEETNKLMRGIGKLSEVYGKFIDDPYRWSSFILHARRRGYRGYDGVVELLSKNTEKVMNDRHSVFEAANRDMVDYERMAPWEKNIARRVFIFYPWNKGSTYFAGRWLRERPIQASVQLHAGQYGREQLRKKVGPVAQFGQQLIPTGTQVVPGLGEVPSVMDLTSAGIHTQPAAFLQAAANRIEGRGGTSIGEFFSPVSSLAFALVTGTDPSTGEKIPGGVLNQIAESIVGSVPLYRFIDVATRPNRVHYRDSRGHIKEYVYPRSWLDQLMRSIFFGGAWPGPINPRAMAKTAQLEGGKTGPFPRKPTTSDWFDDGGSSPSSSGGGGDWFQP